MKTAELLANSGLTQRQLTHWTANGMLLPAGGTGSGNHREWNPRELDRAKLLKRLLDVGMTAEHIGIVLAANREEYPVFMVEVSPGLTLEVSK